MNFHIYRKHEHNQFVSINNDDDDDDGYQKQNVLKMSWFGSFIRFRKKFFCFYSKNFFLQISFLLMRNNKENEIILLKQLREHLGCHISTAKKNEWLSIVIIQRKNCYDCHCYIGKISMEYFPLWMCCFKE